MKNQCGIWIDVRNAYIIDLSETEEGIEVNQKHLTSEIEESVTKGGSRSKTPYGPQGGVSDRRLEERQHREEKQFFEAIIAALDPKTDELVIFGPAKAKHGLLNAIEAHKHFHPQVRGIASADRMTNHQMEAWVRDFYKHPAPRHLPEGVL